MTFTRAALDALVLQLKTGARPIFTEWDVFADVDDDAVGSFEPQDHGRGQGFLAWSASASRAFDGDPLTQPLAMQFGGSAVRLQMLFATAGFTVRIEADEELHELYGHTGTVVVTPDCAELECDLRKLMAAFTDLNDDDVTALPCTGYTQSDGWSDVAEAQRHERQTAVFWTDQGHDAFDALGQLTSTIHLYWRGDAAKIADHIRLHGFSVIVPDDDSTSIQVSAKKSSSARSDPFVPRFRDVLPNEPRVGSRSASVAVRGGGPFVVDVATRSPERKPIRHIAFSPSGARVAVAHGEDMRGGAKHSLVVIDARTGPNGTGAVVATPERREWAQPGCLGVSFLDDTKLVVGWRDYLRRDTFTKRTPPPPASTSSASPAPLSPAPKRVGGRRVVSRPALSSSTSSSGRPSWEQSGMAVVLEIVDVGAPAPPAPSTSRELRVFGFDHAPSLRALAVSPDRAWAAVPSTDGIVLVDLVTGEERGCIAGPPLGAYPSLAMSRDGSMFAWSTDAGPVVKIVDTASGTARGQVTDALAHDGGRGFVDLAFDAQASVLALLCRRHLRNDEVERSVEIYGVDDGKRTWPGVERASVGARSIAFHPTRNIVAFGLEGGFVRLTSTRDGKELARVHVLDGAVTCIAFTDDGARFAAGDEHGRLALGTFDRQFDQ